MFRTLPLYVALLSIPAYLTPVHQPQELVPVHPVHNVQDWDAAPGAIAWPRLITFLQHVKEIGEIPPDHRSHDHLNEQKLITVDDAVRAKWIAEFQQLKKKWAAEGERIIWGLVDGFLLYWHKVPSPPPT